MSDPLLIQQFLAAGSLEGERAHRLRHRLLFASFLLFAAVFFWFAFASAGGFSTEAFLSRLFGGALIILGFWLFLFMAECFARSAAALVPISERELLLLFRNAKEGQDLVEILLTSSAGVFALIRTDINSDAAREYLDRRRINGERMRIQDVSEEKLSDFSQFTLTLAVRDLSFAHFLSEHGVTDTIFASAISWYLARTERKEERGRWWTRERLLAVPSLGALWAYGGTARLDRFARDLTMEAIENGRRKSVPRQEELERVFAVLRRSNERNLLLVAETGGGGEALLEAVAEAFTHGGMGGREGTLRLLSFDGTAFLSTIKDGNGEAELIPLLNEAVAAGNIVLALSDFGSFFGFAAARKIDLQAILDPYLAGPLPIIAVIDAVGYHAEIEPRSELMRRFEKLAVSEESGAEILADILSAVPALEREYGVMVTYQAAVALSKAGKYFPETDARDKAHDLLEEIMPAARAGGDCALKEKDVLALIMAKTKIPVGAVEGGEKEKLLNLEKLLHERVIGQDEGIAAISRAMRRARAGIGSGKRPLGSFLLLGPTGVGKTETAKALAEIFFGNEKHMVRLDMSEYQEEGSIARLIGSFESGKAGTFVSMMRDNPYCVVLLDEFEKASEEVRRLFLQVLDEGQFSDMVGKPVSLRNAIVIATSNAVSDKIFTLVESGARLPGGQINLEEHREELINEIISRGIFSPELLNRFDAAVFYRPMTKAELGQVARLMLVDFARRLKEKGVVFVVNDAVLRTLLKYGYDPKFGARPMRRALQDHIEDLIARRLIDGSIKRGDTVVLKEEELA